MPAEGKASHRAPAPSRRGRQRREQAGERIGGSHLPARMLLPPPAYQQVGGLRRQDRQGDVEGDIGVEAVAQGAACGRARRMKTRVTVNRCRMVTAQIPARPASIVAALRTTSRNDAARR
ncbi:hypothetical protein GCM10014719_48480 [Planomonospora parontospora subsp. antibiotica]|nr:hypothetical protein GCM10014719_48480 [Planomonospora parontospora subsp. antibiotica]GII17977.1 hypothetical protein Ppa05_47030 [Planomonospora parontospora subsp. antibiotica]